jgi:hypothetical protein
MNRAFVRKFRDRSVQYFRTPPADINRSAEFQKARSHALAQARATTGNENAFGSKKVGIKHGIKK